MVVLTGLSGSTTFRRCATRHVDDVTSYMQPGRSGLMLFDRYWPVFRDERVNFDRRLHCCVSVSYKYVQRSSAWQRTTTIEDKETRGRTRIWFCDWLLLCVPIRYAESLQPSQIFTGCDGLFNKAERWSQKEWSRFRWLNAETYAHWLLTRIQSSLLTRPSWLERLWHSPPTCTLHPNGFRE
jgi:hypothetical protein